MRSTEIQRVLATMTGRPLSEMDARCRPLRKALTFSTGPRGVHAPHMNSSEIAVHVLAMVSQRPADSLVVARRLLTQCMLVPHPDFPDLFAEWVHGGLPFGAVVEAMISGDGLARIFRFETVEMHESGYFAWANLKLDEGRGLKLLFAVEAPVYDAGTTESPRDHYEGVDRAVSGNRFVISTTALMLLDADVSRSGDDIAVRIVPGAGPLRLRRKSDAE